MSDKLKLSAMGIFEPQEHKIEEKIQEEVKRRVKQHKKLSGQNLSDAIERLKEYATLLEQIDRIKDDFMYWPKSKRMDMRKLSACVRDLVHTLELTDPNYVPPDYSSFD